MTGATAHARWGEATFKLKVCNSLSFPWQLEAELLHFAYGMHGLLGQ